LLLCAFTPARFDKQSYYFLLPFQVAQGRGVEPSLSRALTNVGSPASSSFSLAVLGGFDNFFIGIGHFVWFPSTGSCLLTGSPP
jgi:hypothetical protein